MPPKLRDAMFYLVVAIGLIVLLYVILSIGTGSIEPAR